MEVNRDQLVLSPPYTIPSINERGINPFSIALQLIKDIRPGFDLADFQVPPQLNIPKSGLQIYSEPIYCYNHDLLTQCATVSGTSIDRFLRVLTWHFSTIRPLPFCQAPFNPILGETHHVSSGSLNIIVEQVSHHPQMCALYATNETCGIRLLSGGRLISHFRGSKADSSLPCDKTLWLDLHKEKYDMKFPMLTTRLFPSPGNEWTGISSVTCKSSGLEARINFKSKSLFGLRGSTSAGGQITGYVMDTFGGVVLYEISGHWNRMVMIKDMKTGVTSVLYDAISTLASLKPLTLRLDHDEVGTLETSESVVVWREAMQALMRKDWAGTKAAKHEVAEKQRLLATLRMKEGNAWVPKYFVKIPGSEEWHWRGGEGKHVPPSPLRIDHQFQS